jgi:hypothetical protein
MNLLFFEVLLSEYKRLTKIDLGSMVAHKVGVIKESVYYNYAILDCPHVNNVLPI